MKGYCSQLARELHVRSLLAGVSTLLLAQRDGDVRSILWTQFVCNRSRVCESLAGVATDSKFVLRWRFAGVTGLICRYMQTNWVQSILLTSPSRCASNRVDTPARSDLTFTFKAKLLSSGLHGGADGISN